MYIPYNFTLEEALELTNVDESILKKINDRLNSNSNKLDELETSIEAYIKQEELMEERLGNMDMFIERVMELTKETTKHKDLVKGIKEALENYNIEY